MGDMKKPTPNSRKRHYAKTRRPKFPSPPHRVAAPAEALHKMTQSFQGLGAELREEIPHGAVAAIPGLLAEGLSVYDKRLSCGSR
jgi:hypothetical protein